MASSNSSRRVGRIPGGSGSPAGAKSKTRWLLLGSVSANVALLALCCILGMRSLAGNRESAASAPIPISAAAPPVAMVVQQAPQPAATRPFHWSQVEADDFETYVANLRSIGCPEETIRSIVRSEIGAAYEEQRRKAEAENRRPMLPSERRKLEEEQSAVLSQLFAPSRHAGSPASAAAEPPVRRPAAVYPLVFQNVHPISAPQASQSGRSVGAGQAATGAGSGREQIAASAEALDLIRREFTEDLGPNQNPADPDYLKRWTRAQSLADLRLRGMMGVGYYNAYTLELARQAVEEERKQGR